MKLAHAPLATALGLALTVVLALAPAGAPASADEKPGAPGVKPDSTAVEVLTKVADEPSKNQAPQYAIADQLTHWGFSVDSRVATKWDKFLKKAGVTVPAAPEGDRKDAPKAARVPTAFAVEGTIDIHFKPTTFYGKSVTNNFVAKVDATVKDAQGKVLKTIAFQHLFGMNLQDGREKAQEATEIMATRFLILEVMTTDAISSLVAADKRDEFTKFVASEEEFRKANFDDATKHEVKEGAAKGGHDENGK